VFILGDVCDVLEIGFWEHFCGGEWVEKGILLGGLP
jgi:hypothetical protein